VTSGLSIAAVARQTGIPVTTLRFYEKELPGLFAVRKTRGGHRRYDAATVERLATVRRLTREGLPLADVRRALLGERGEENVAARQGTAETLLADVAARLSALETRVARLETAAARRKGWFRRE